MKQGFGGSAVRGIVEDGNEDIWFATDGGVLRYNTSLANSSCNKETCNHNLKNESDFKAHKLEREKLFTNFTMMDVLQDKMEYFGLVHQAVYFVMMKKIIIL